MKVLAFGEILWDIIEGKPHLGGAPLNFIAHMAQYGVKSYIISRVGNDSFGETALSQAAKYGVNTTLIQLDAIHETGTVDVKLENGQPDYWIKNEVAYDFIEFNELESRIGSLDFDLFYFGSLAQRGPVSADTLKAIFSTHKFKHVFYDVNLRKGGYSKLIIMNSLRLCDVLKLNVDEVSEISEVLFEDLFFSLRQFCELVSEIYAIKIIVITAAEKGCYVFEKGNFI
ncbi:MAG: PfkB family carbohydrate kinase, partial [Daejeonella sp.]